jgi:hypothetical protein
VRRIVHGGCAALLLFSTGCSSHGAHARATSTSTTPKGSASSKRVFADPNGFGGYAAPGSVTEISATWTVPTITENSQPGHASTWVGVQNSAGDFIQLGTTEDNTPTGAEYIAFWSDTDAGFLPRNIGFVRAGDTVTADMVQRPDGWELNIDDTSVPLPPAVASHYGAGTAFTSSSWTQEDPSPSVPSVTDEPYPTMSPVSFTHVLLNEHAPTLAYDGNAHVLSSPNGVFLVPTHFNNDGFSVQPATPLQARYLAIIESVNAHTNLLNAPVAAGNRAAALAVLPAVIDSITAANTQLAATTWPPKIRASIAALIHISSESIASLRAWQSNASADTKALVSIFSNKTRTDAANQVRRALGLPRAR